MRPISGLLRRARIELGLRSRSLLSNGVYLDGDAISLSGFVAASCDKYVSVGISRGVGVSDSCALSSGELGDSDPDGLGCS